MEAALIGAFEVRSVNLFPEQEEGCAKFHDCAGELFRQACAGCCYFPSHEALQDIIANDVRPNWSYTFLQNLLRNRHSAVRGQ